MSHSFSKFEPFFDFLTDFVQTFFQVWNNLNGGAAEHVSGLCGSPLDLLPSPPSQLPMPPGDDTDKVGIFLKYIS